MERVLNAVWGGNVSQGDNKCIQKTICSTKGGTKNYFLNNVDSLLDSIVNNLKDRNQGLKDIVAGFTNGSYSKLELESLKSNDLRKNRLIDDCIRSHNETLSKSPICHSQEFLKSLSTGSTGSECTGSLVPDEMLTDNEDD
ncbi:hypothetical protein HOG98_03480 [bacterium]|jgi:hypothetical protein|nr:hypothetical protein [bacterium]